MRASLEARLQRLESRAADEALCTDPRCKHMELTRLARRVNGLPEYPLPPHPKIEPKGARGALAAALASLNRRPDESAEAYADRMKPKPYVDPHFSPITTTGAPTCE